MPNAGPLRIVWAYDRAHREHPFIVLGLETLAAAGHDAIAVTSDDGPADAAYTTQAAFSFAPRASNYERRIAGASRGSLRHVWAALLWRTFDLWRVYARGFRALWRANADVVMASRPQAAFVALCAAKLRGARFVYYPFELYGDQLTPGVWWIKALEGISIRAADALVTQNTARAQVYVRERGAQRAPVVVRNFKRGLTALPSGGALRRTHPEFAANRIVLYEGQLVDGRWLDRLVQSLEHCPPDVILAMMGPEKGKWVKQNAALLDAAKAARRLAMLAPVPQETLPDFIADADVGVIIYDDSVRNNRLCEPGKLSDYIGAGIPVIAPNFPTVASLINDYGLGATFAHGEPKSIAAAIMAVLATPRQKWAQGAARAREELTWESQTPAFLAAVTGREAHA